MTKDGDSNITSLRTTQDRWIAFPPLDKGKRWKTLNDVETVLVSAVDDPGDPQNVSVHIMPADEVRRRFDKSYAARIAQGHTVRDNFGMWVMLDKGDPKSTPMPARLDEGVEELAAAYVASLSLGAGQFCTNPGLVFVVAGDAEDCFVKCVRDALPTVAAQTMLTQGIKAAYEKGIARLNGMSGAELVGVGAEGSSACGQVYVYSVSGAEFRKNRAYQDEVFGPSSIIVRCRDFGEITEILAGLEGQLTATLHMTDADHVGASKLIPMLEQIAGRIIANAWPTGVDVTHAIVHGGPFPATSDGRSTSVGTLAIDRFLRPVSYQGLPEELLPNDLREDARVSLVRKDGIWHTAE